MTPIFFTGDDWTINQTLQLNGANYDASGGTINAAIVSMAGDEPTQQIATTLQSEGTPGADWTNGLIVVKFPAASTDLATYGTNLFLELQVEKGGEKMTWPRKAITVKKGTIA